MSNHPAISPPSIDLSESWLFESSKPIIKYVYVLDCLVEWLLNYGEKKFQTFVKNTYFSKFLNSTRQYNSL